jgi:hypothetical protein
MLRAGGEFCTDDVGYDAYGGDIDYNDAWENASAWKVVAGKGTHNLDVDPKFENALDDNYRLKSISTLVNAGDPAAAYNDVDGTRNDLGIFGGPAGDWTP